ncbi:endolytic transglycosylase MltG [Agromyces archimandritae]|uniref:Endolytic murein transglycosylase n=2 Tax=Agromyces archimandritae TaxID=2781962 RepID=A0A975FQY7_9MICO|nr:endolytic transglycosylase MltG [Agromyces archimandritae]
MRTGRADAPPRPRQPYGTVAQYGTGEQYGTGAQYDAGSPYGPQPGRGPANGGSGPIRTRPGPGYGPQAGDPSHEQPATRREIRDAEQARREQESAEAANRPNRSDRRAFVSDELGQPPEPPSKKRRKGPIGCGIALLIVLVIGVGGYFLLQGPINDVIARFQPAADYEGAGRGEVVFVINEGENGTDIAENLHEQGVTASAEAFTELLATQSPEPQFMPGAYRLAEKMSAQAALDALQDPEHVMQTSVLIREGEWAKNVFAEISSVTGIAVEELEAAAADPAALGLPAEAKSVEGFLFPATYTFDPDATAEQIVQRMVDRSFESLDAAGVKPEDRYRVVTIASLLEREAREPDDFFKVSRVIQNRLAEGMMLQFDSTVHYGIGDDSVVTTTDAERADPANPYNTYAHLGLPPGPIGNPGDHAIDAALHPADGPWLYFVTVNPDTGETVFSATFEEHEAAVEQFYTWLEEHPDGQ